MTLLSRHFFKKCVRASFHNFYTVCSLALGPQFFCASWENIPPAILYWKIGSLWRNAFSNVSAFWAMATVLIMTTTAVCLQFVTLSHSVEIMEIYSSTKNSWKQHFACTIELSWFHEIFFFWWYLKSIFMNFRQFHTSKTSVLVKLDKLICEF